MLVRGLALALLVLLLAGMSCNGQFPTFETEILRFEADQYEIVDGEMVWISWDVANPRPESDACRIIERIVRVGGEADENSYPVECWGERGFGPYHEPPNTTVSFAILARRIGAAGDSPNPAEAYASQSLDVALNTNPFYGRIILYYVDSTFFPDVAWFGLDTAIQSGAQLVEVHDAEFLAAIGAGPDLVVYFRQGSSSFPEGHLTALLNWVDGGGHLVFAHWDTGVDASTLANAMQSGFTFTDNYASMIVGHADLSEGLSSTTVPFTNPGWGTYNVGLTTTGGGTALAYYSGTAIPSIVRGLGGQTYLLGWLSDSIDETDGSRLYTNIFRAALRHLALTE